MSLSLDNTKAKYKNFRDEYPKLTAALAVFLFLLSIVLLYFLCKLLGWPSEVFSVILGVFLGLGCGMSLPDRVSRNIKFGAVGMFSGMGLDGILGLTADNSEAATVINTIALSLDQLFGHIYTLINPHASSVLWYNRISIVLWTMTIVFALYIVSTLIINPKKEEDAAISAQPVNAS